VLSLSIPLSLPLSTLSLSQCSLSLLPPQLSVKLLSAVHISEGAGLLSVDEVFLRVLRGLGPLPRPAEGRRLLQGLDVGVVGVGLGPDVCQDVGFIELVGGAEPCVEIGVPLLVVSLAGPAILHVYRGGDVGGVPVVHVNVQVSVHVLFVEVVDGSVACLGRPPPQASPSPAGVVVCWWLPLELGVYPAVRVVLGGRVAEQELARVDSEAVNRGRPNDGALSGSGACIGVVFHEERGGVLCHVVQLLCGQLGVLVIGGPGSVGQAVHGHALQVHVASFEGPASVGVFDAFCRVDVW